MTISCPDGALKRDRSKQFDIVAGTMKYAMHVNRQAFDCIEDEIFLNDEITISKTEKFFFVGNETGMGVAGKKLKGFLDSCCKLLGSRRIVSKYFAKGKPVFVGIDVHKRDWTVHVLCLGEEIYY